MTRFECIRCHEDRGDSVSLICIHCEDELAFNLNNGELDGRDKEIIALLRAERRSREGSR